jgi:hypothetical protein
VSAVKLLMSWDILPGREEDYFEFHIRNFVPALESMGLNLSEAWLTVYGEHPRLMAEAIMPNYRAAQLVLASSEWEDLGYQLDDFVENFSCKVIPAKSGFQL